MATTNTPSLLYIRNMLLNPSSSRCKRVGELAAGVSSGFRCRLLLFFSVLSRMHHHFLLSIKYWRTRFLTATADDAYASDFRICSSKCDGAFEQKSLCRRHVHPSQFSLMRIPMEKICCQGSHRIQSVWAIILPWGCP